MKPHLALFLSILFFIPSLACGSFTTTSVVGSGNIVSQTLNVSSFDRVTLYGSGKVFIEQGQTESLSVETDDNIISLLDIRIKGDELILGVKRGFDVDPSESIIYNLTVTDLRAIKLAGSGSFLVGPIDSKEFQVLLPGSGDIKIERLMAKELAIDLAGSGNITLDDIHVKILDTSLRGSGDIKLEGTTKEETVVVRGSGNYRAANLQSKAAHISIPGSASVAVWVTSELKIRVNGSGDIQYYGDPVVRQSGFGSSHIIWLGEK